MRALRRAFLQILFSVFLLAIAFWPHYGAAWYMAGNFSAQPELFSVSIAVWVAALSLNLPLTLRMFQTITTGSITAIFAVCLYALWDRGYFAADNSESWIITAIVMVGVLIGWWTVSVRLWRWWRAVLPTDDVEET